LRFVKLEAAGNDLILIDSRRQSLRAPADLAVRICDRHFGAGADGLLTVEAGPDDVPLMRMFNPDGTEDFCGNGLRCVAAWLWQSGEAEGGRVVVRTTKGEHEGIVRPTGPRGFEVEVQVVVPQFAPGAIPVCLASERIVEYPLEVGGRTVRISCVSTGTAHTVIFSDTDVDEEEFTEVSPLIECHPMFPERTSVLWCRAQSRDRIRMRIWERGVGETYSCGTGTCASVVIGRTLGRTGNRAEVVTRGGSLWAQWNGTDAARLIGPVRIVYTGRIRTEN